MDYDFYISSLLYKLKNNELSLTEVCDLFPEENRDEIQTILADISFPIDVETLKKITGLFSKE